MSGAHELLNASGPEQARALLGRCCGSTRWVEGMLARRPFASATEMHTVAAEVWQGLTPADWLEAFRHHPRIGQDAGPGERWSREEQTGALQADADMRRALREANAAYERRFGFIFLVCATGKTADAMLGLLESRMGNDADVEIRVASAEQAKITRLRLDKLAP